MQPVQTVVDEKERQRAEQLAGGEQKVSASEKRLAELTQYEADYRHNFKNKVSAGMSSLELRDYQMFLAKLAEAIRQQNALVSAARQERDEHRTQWQHAAQRAKAVENVIDHWQAEERKATDRREQRDSDERANRAAHNRRAIDSQSGDQDSNKPGSGD
jgi:flagellar FliJ protein